jgi:hypothetical protein
MGDRTIAAVFADGLGSSQGVRCSILLLLKAGAAENGSALDGAKGHGSFGSAIGADGTNFRAWAGSAGGTFSFAGLAVFGVVGEPFFVEEKLFSCGEHKFITA